MITNADITLFHSVYDPVRRMDGYVKAYYPEVSWHRDTRAEVGDGGLRTADVVRIRIPTEAEVLICTGDRVVPGKCQDQTPPKEAASVVSFSDNRRGLTPHWRVTCA